MKSKMNSLDEGICMSGLTGSEERKSVRSKNLPSGGVESNGRDKKILLLVLEWIQRPCYEYGEIQETYQLNKHKLICVSILSRLRNIGYVWIFI